MKQTANIEYIGEGVDRLITLDLRARGVIYKLYEAARELVETPLALTAARQIMDTIEKKDYVIITTGFILPPENIQESDGPPGAVALARALNLAFKVKPIFIIEEKSKQILSLVINAIGMKSVAIDELTKNEEKHAAAIIGFPLELGEAEREAKEILDEYNPSVVIAIEKPGRNIKGEYHTMRGLNISSFHAKVEPLIEEAQKRGLLTIGIGDGGNEIGMGNIKGTVEKFVPYAKVCQCPCKGGIAAESKVDLLITASISNWGAYGIEACIEAITGNKGILHSPKLEEAMLKNLFEAGAVDGATCQNKPLVDGIPHNIHLSVIDMLKTLISN